MVRFSCFNAQINSHTLKKTAETSVGAMPKAAQDLSQVQAPKTLAKATSFNLPMQADAQITDGAIDVTSCMSVEQSWKSERIEDRGIPQRRLMKKCQSLGSGLCHEGLVFCDDTEAEIDQGFSSDSLDHHGLARPDGSKDTEISQTSQHEKAPELESVPMSSDFFNNECIFSIADTLHSERGGPENFDAPLSGEDANGSRNQSPHSPPVIVKSNSLPNIGPYLPTSGRHSYEYVAPHSRSSDDLHALGMRWKEFSIHGDEMQITREEVRDDIAPRTEENNFESCLDEGFDSYNYSASAKDWIMPVVDEVNLGNNLPGESSTRQWEELPSKDFKMKRIEDWVNNLRHHGPLEETIGLPDSDDLVKRNLNDLTSGKVENKVSLGMEAAKRYISSLSASATTANLSNHGLAVIPFLSAFGSLRVLNLSGNSIVRITAGALPRGLHMLNLSKNNISTIEGLRELTRLRVLDLSYNRIFRIGHGLASCSSLKELYMAGNKISEAEGLHRLLKLTVLDLRFNKISTAKCLGQLAANYNSLQAISLEGNPAQKNVGDEQLKKHLQGLLPHLVYFNRQPIKAGTLKDAADRSVRLGISTHQFDRGIRSDNKSARRGSHGLAGARPSSSSTHARKSQAVISPKQSRGRHVRLPPSGTKATTSHRHHYIDFGSKLLNLKSELAFHRSQSEGTLGAI